MPAYRLSDDDVRSLASFLAWIDASGSSRVPADAVHWSGTYVIERDWSPVADAPTYADDVDELEQN